MILAWLAFFDGVIAVALAFAGVIAAHYELTQPFMGFTIFAGGLFFAALGVVLGLLATLMTALSAKRREALPRALLGLGLAVVVIAPAVIVIVTHPYPAINDITTDTTNPPEFAHAQELPANQGRDMKYDAKTYASVQTSAPAYKDLAPLKLDEPPDEAYKKSRHLGR